MQQETYHSETTNVLLLTVHYYSETVPLMKCVGSITGHALKGESLQKALVVLCLYSYVESSSRVGERPREVRGLRHMHG